MVALVIESVAIKYYNSSPYFKACTYKVTNSWQLTTKVTINCEYESVISHCKVKLKAISVSVGLLARPMFGP